MTEASLGESPTARTVAPPAWARPPACLVPGMAPPEDGARSPAALPAGTLDALQEGFAVHDGEGRQVHANAVLRGLAEAQDGFQWHQQAAVLPTDPMACRLLRRALVAAASGTPVDMAVPRPSGAAPFLLRCAPVPGHQGWSVLRVTDPAARRRPPPLSFLRGAFRLTEAEAALATALCCGTSVIDYAEARRISVHTVRTQLRALLQKTGAERQVDLINLLTAIAR